MKCRKYPLFFLLIINLMSFISCQKSSSDKESNHAKLDEYMQRAEKTGFSGAVIIAQDGKILLSEGCGLANREKNIRFTSSTVSTIGSVTKQFTGAAILKLQEQGKLKVDDPISKYFYNVPGDKKEVTLHHLLTHTAGFPGAIGFDFDPITREEFIRLALDTPLERKPGEMYEYSNVGFSLLGAIIELITGDSYEKYLRENLFKPAGMDKTGYLIPNWQPDELAHGYLKNGDDWGSLVDHPWAEDGPYWNLRANGGILSTVEDLYKWHLALNSNKILSDSSKALLFKPYVREGENANSFYGYGWAIFETPRNTRLIAHNGGNGIFAADFQRFVDENVVIIGLSNTAGKPAFRFTEDIARIVFNEPYKLPPEKIEKIDKAELEKSEIGRRALALLNAYSEKDEQALRKFINDNFAPSLIQRATVEKLLSIIKTDRPGIGDCIFGHAIKTGENSLELIVQAKKTGQWWRLMLDFEEQAPQRIAGIGIEDTEGID